MNSSTKELFTHFYNVNGWGGKESRSGEGSNFEQTRVIRETIPVLFKRFHITSFLDAPCGDLFWMKEMDLGNTQYIGADIVSPLIEKNKWEYPDKFFIEADIVTSELPQVDLIFCRDCLVHLKLDQIKKAIENFKNSGSTYLLTTTFTGVNMNQERPEPGFWRPLNLLLPPFSFPSPLEIINEGCTQDGGRYADKSLGLWKLSDL